MFGAFRHFNMEMLHIKALKVGCANLIQHTFCQILRISPCRPLTPRSVYVLKKKNLMSWLCAWDSHRILFQTDQQ